MTSRPKPGEDAILIRLVRQAAGLSVADAAGIIRLSKQRWSQIETGYEKKNGEYVPTTRLPERIAEMAWAVGVDVPRLAAVNPEAARILEEMIRREGERRPSHLKDAPRFEDAEEQKIADDIWVNNPGMPVDVREGMIGLAIRMRRARQDGNGGELERREA